MVFGVQFMIISLTFRFFYIYLLLLLIVFSLVFAVKMCFSFFERLVLPLCNDHAVVYKYYHMLFIYDSTLVLFPFFVAVFD